MNGLDMRLKCKACGAEYLYDIGMTEVYDINSLGIEYLPIVCRNCGQLHYLAIHCEIIEEMTENAKEMAFKKAFIHKKKRIRQKGLFRKNQIHITMGCDITSIWPSLRRLIVAMVLASSPAPHQ